MRRNVKKYIIISNSYNTIKKIWRLRAFDPYKFITPSMVIKILPTAKAGDIAPRHEVEAFCSIN